MENDVRTLRPLSGPLLSMHYYCNCKCIVFIVFTHCSGYIMDTKFFICGFLIMIMTTSVIFKYLSETCYKSITTIA